MKKWLCLGCLVCLAVPIFAQDDPFSTIAGSMAAQAHPGSFNVQLGLGFSSISLILPSYFNKEDIPPFYNIMTWQIGMTWRIVYFGRNVAMGSGFYIGKRGFAVNDSDAVEERSRFEYLQMAVPLTLNVLFRAGKNVDIEISGGVFAAQHTPAYVIDEDGKKVLFDDNADGDARFNLASAGLTFSGNLLFFISKGSAFTLGIRGDIGLSNLIHSDDYTGEDEQGYKTNCVMALIGITF